MNWIAVIGIGYLTLVFVNWLQYGLSGFFWGILHVGWLIMAYIGHLKYPKSRGPIRPGAALLWTLVWSPHGVFKFLFLRG